MKEYSFTQVVQEANWALMGANTLGKLRSSTAGRGAAVGAAAGAIGGVAKNALKSDDDPTKKGMLRSAVGGASKGAVGGAAVGWAAGKLARTNAGEQLRKNLGVKGVDQAGTEAGRNAVAGLGAKAFKNGKDGEVTQQAMDTFNKAKDAEIKKYSWTKQGSSGLSALNPHNHGRFKAMTLGKKPEIDIPVQ